MKFAGRSMARPAGETRRRGRHGRNGRCPSEGVGDPVRRRTAVAGLVVYAVLLVAVVGEAAHGHPPNRAHAIQVIYQEFGRTQVAACMVEIVDRETGGTFHPKAANWRDRHTDGSRGSFGLFQIGALHRRPGETIMHFAQRMYQPRQAARLAHRLYESSGFAPWGGYCR